MKTKYAPFIIVSISVLLTGISMDLFGATINVPGDYATIQAAIGVASDGDIINIASGTYTEAGIKINKSVTIQGQGQSNTIVQAQRPGPRPSDVVFDIPVTPRLMVTIKDLTAQYGTIGIYTRNMGTLTLSTCTLRSNSGITLEAFGGITHDGRGTVALTDCTISSNGWGGILTRYGTSILTNCTLSYNDVGIWNGATSILTNCTIFGSSFAYGVFNCDGTTTFINCTLSNNEVTGIFNEDGVVEIKNTIIADNAAGEGGSDVEGTITSLDHNLIENIGDATIEGITTHNIYGQGPMLLPLADNGGFTQTCALQEGSPAINAGTDEGAPSTDQRGYDRVGASDIGAYEYVETIIPAVQQTTWGQIKAQF